MDRSFAARAARPLGRPSAARRGGAGSTAPRSAGALRRLPLTGASALARAVGVPLGFVWRHPRGRIVLLSVLAFLPLLAGGWLLVRKSPFVSVQKVHVSGLHGPQSG